MVMSRDRAQRAPRRTGYAGSLRS